MKKSSCVKYIIKIAVFIAVVVLIDRFIGMSFVALKDYGLKHHPQCVWLRPQYVMEKVDDDVLFFGSSRTSRGVIASMVEDSLDLTAYNCGQEACLFLYQNCLINSLIDRYSPKCIIWEINPATIGKDFLPIEYQNVRYLSPYYDENEYVRQFVDGGNERNKLYMYSQMYRYNSKLFGYLFPIISGSDNTEKGYSPLPATGYKCPQMIKLKERSAEDVQPFCEKKCDMLSATLRRCAEKDIPVMLITIPTYSEVSTETMDNIEKLKCISDKCQVPFVNYIGDSRLMQAEFYYKDAVHLNDYGAAMFTQLLIEECIPLIFQCDSLN